MVDIDDLHIALETYGVTSIEVEFCEPVKNIMSRLLLNSDIVLTSKVNPISCQFIFSNKSDDTKGDTSGTDLQKRVSNTCRLFKFISKSVYSQNHRPNIDTLEYWILSLREIIVSLAQTFPLEDMVEQTRILEACLLEEGG
jgi:hypothetical protein